MMTTCDRRCRPPARPPAHVSQPGLHVLILSLYTTTNKPGNMSQNAAAWIPEAKAQLEVKEAPTWTAEKGEVLVKVSTLALVIPGITCSHATLFRRSTRFRSSRSTGRFVIVLLSHPERFPALIPYHNRSKTTTSSLSRTRSFSEPMSPERSSRSARVSRTSRRVTASSGRSPP